LSDDVHPPRSAGGAEHLRVSLLGLFAVLSAGLITPATRSFAQDQPAPAPTNVIAGIEIEGNRTVSEAAIRQKITHTRVGQALDTVAVRQDVDALKLTNQFKDVYATPVRRDGQLIVIFHVVERTVVASIEFPTAKRFKPKELLKLLQFSEGDFLDTYQVRLGAEAIEDHYRDAGYTDVRVSVDEAALETGRVVYLITEGPRVRITAIRFQGNETYSSRQLKSKIGSKTYIWLFRRGQYSESQIQDDITALRNFYISQGFLDVQVGRTLQFSPDRQKLTVTFLIQEGQRYRIRSINVRGNERFDAEQILAQMKSRSGDTLLAQRIETDRKNILKLYNSEGYLYASVAVTHSFTDEPGQVDLNVDIEEDRPYTIGRIIVRGNTQTQDRVIRRVLEFQPGDKFDLTQMENAELRLRETRLFSDVKIEPTGEEPDYRDALIQVEETMTTRVIAGVGVSSNSGVLGNLSLESWNFDIFDWPRSAKELFSGQAFKGGGQTLRLSLEPGTEITRFRIAFREPYLMDLPLSLGWSAYLFDRDRDGYSERRAGTIVSFGKRFKKIYGAEAALRFEGVRVDDVDRFLFFFAPDDIEDVEGWNFLTTLKLSLVRDTTDSFFLPSRGTRMVASWEQAGLFGGDFSFSKILGSATFYRTLRTDTFDRKTIWASNFEVGYIGGGAPVFERFYGGGIGSIRGFNFRGISPRQCPGDTRIGGNFMTLVGNEISFPLVGKDIRGVTFLDMGTVEDSVSISKWRAAVGFGLRLTVDFFGPVPMAFDFAWPIARDPDDDTQVFSFSLGASFR